MVQKDAELVRAAGIPVFSTAEEEGAFWETHSPLDYPEYFTDGDDLRIGHTVLRTDSFYRPELGNIPLPFPVIPISNSREQDPSDSPSRDGADT